MNIINGIALRQYSDSSTYKQSYMITLRRLPMKASTPNKSSTHKGYQKVLYVRCFERDNAFSICFYNIIETEETFKILFCIFILYPKG